ncbi:hypothetical protein COD11_05135 [Bacillus sp. AFS040349]|nr:hypothetical protein COD11_05135 [Bacillus sp. AFS040349]
MEKIHEKNRFYKGCLWGILISIPIWIGIIYLVVKLL